MVMIDFHQVREGTSLCKHAQNTTKPMKSLPATAHNNIQYARTVLKYTEPFSEIHLEKYSPS